MGFWVVLALASLLLLIPRRLEAGAGQHNFGERIVKKINVLVVAVAAMLSAPAAFAQDAQADQNMPWRLLISASGPYFYPEAAEQSVGVFGEKLDSVLGELAPTSSASEYDSPARVAG